MQRGGIILRNEEINLIIGKISEKNRVADILKHERMRMCAEYWRRYICNQCGLQELQTYLCHDRFCPYCQRFRALKNAFKLRDFLKRYKPKSGLKFLTLTIKNVYNIKKSDLQRLRRCYYNLRYRIKRNGYGFYGGVYSIETTYKSKKSGFHPHIHAIVDMDFIEHDKLSAWWYDITGDSFIVGINNYREGTEYEVVKYMVKTMEFPPDQLRQYYKITKRMRLIQATGWKLSVDDGEKEMTGIFEIPCQCGGLLTLQDGLLKIHELSLVNA